MATRTENRKPLILWIAIDKKTGKVIDRDSDFLRLTRRLEKGGYNPQKISYSQELAKGLWIL